MPTHTCAALPPSHPIYAETTHIHTEMILTMEKLSPVRMESIPKPPGRHRMDYESATSDPDDCKMQMTHKFQHSHP